MMPSRHALGLAGGRPPRGDIRGLGKRSLIRFHWESLMNGFGAVLDPVLFGRRRGGHIDREMTMSVSLFKHTQLQLSRQFNTF